MTRSACPPAQRWAFVAVLALAAGLRAWVALNTGPVHPDEIFQYLEQAHRIVFGNGIVTWESRYGMRSALLPLLLSVPMRIGDGIAPGSDLYLILPRLSMAAFSLVAVVAAYGLGARLSRFHGFVAMAVAAVWPDIAYFGGHVLTEPASTALVLAGAALLLPEEASRRHLLLAGLLLGLAGILRFHYLPAIAVLVLLSCGTDWRGRWLPLIGGGLVAAAIGACVDLAMGQAPFGWIVANFVQNVVVNRSADFGVQPPLVYLTWLGIMWSFALAAIPLLILPVLKPYRALIAAAVFNLLLHGLIGHKEYRFIFLTVAILVVVAAIGSAKLVRRLQPKLSPRGAMLAAIAVVPLWFGASAALASAGKLATPWRAFFAGSEAALALRDQPGLCGVGIVSLNVWDTGGYTYLRRPLPIYASAPPFGKIAQPPLAQITPAFNGIIVPETAVGRLPAGYRLVGCSSAHTGIDPQALRRPVRVCAFLRPGGCDAAAGAGQDIQSVMKRHDW